MLISCPIIVFSEINVGKIIVANIANPNEPLSFNLIPVIKRNTTAITPPVKIYGRRKPVYPVNRKVINIPIYINAEAKYNVSN